MTQKEQFEPKRPYSRASILAARYGKHAPPVAANEGSPTLTGAFTTTRIAIIRPGLEEDYSDKRTRHMPSREAAEAEAADPNSVTRLLMQRCSEAVFARKLSKGYRALGPLETVRVSVVHNLGPLTVAHAEYEIVVQSYCRLVKV